MRYWEVTVAQKGRTLDEEGKHWCLRDWSFDHLPSFNSSNSPVFKVFCAATLPSIDQVAQIQCLQSPTS